MSEDKKEELKNNMFTNKEICIRKRTISSRLVSHH